MRQFEVKLSDPALEDADRVYAYIANEVLAPMTAALYYQGLLKKCEVSKWEQMLSLLM